MHEQLSTNYNHTQATNQSVKQAEKGDRLWEASPTAI